MRHAGRCGLVGQTSRRARTGLLALLVGTIALALSASALAAHPEKSAHFQGTTTQGESLSFRVSSTGKRVRHVHFYLVTDCSNGASSYVKSGGGVPQHTHSSIKPSGRFSWTLVFPKHHYKSGYVASAKVTLRGRFTSPTTATGVLKGKSKYYPTTKYPEKETCSGSTEFTATG